VLRRRARGELITVAQSMFEQPSTPGAPIQYSTVQGDAPAPPLQAAVPAAPNAIRVAETDDLRRAEPVRASVGKGAARAVKAAETSRVKKKDPRATYLVQVGSFGRKADAHDWLAEVRQRFGTHFAEAEGKVIAGGGRYRTRFDGLTKSAAVAACRALRAKRLACMVMEG
jgi:D-alanyl-D-alanine carboxypeptidase (penicillin-binding protein 5/6)